jgi:hypothetical protein
MKLDCVQDVRHHLSKGTGAPLGKREYVTVSAFAKEFNFNPFTVRRWCREGVIEAVRAPTGRIWRVLRSEIDRVRRGEPLPMHAA